MDNHDIETQANRSCRKLVKLGNTALLQETESVVSFKGLEKVVAQEEETKTSNFMILRPRKI